MYFQSKTFHMLWELKKSNTEREVSNAWLVPGVWGWWVSGNLNSPGFPARLEKLGRSSLGYKTGIEPSGLHQTEHFSTGNKKRKPFTIEWHLCYLSRFKSIIKMMLKTISLVAMVSTITCSPLKTEVTKAASPYVNIGCQCSPLTFVDQYGTVQVCRGNHF